MLVSGFHMRSLVQCRSRALLLAYRLFCETDLPLSAQPRGLPNLHMPVTAACFLMLTDAARPAQVFSGLLIGAMLPYWFSSMTMKSVGKAALAMVDEVRHQFNTIAGLMEGTARPDYKRCVEISTKVGAPRPVTPSPHDGVACSML